MLDLDKWQEIFTTIRQNKLRTVLTGFSVGWGIFMLILLLGAGNGLHNGVRLEFSGDATNSLRIYTGATRLPYKGMKPGRRIRLTNEDYEDIKKNVPGVEYITARYWLPGQMVISYEQKYGDYSVRSVHPDHKFLENSIVAEGRYLNPNDLAEYRKVAVIGMRVKEEMFGQESPIGKMINLNNISFKIVGVFREAGRDGEEEAVIYIPISTAQRTFNGQNRIDQILLTVGDASVEESQEMADQIRLRLANKHIFDPDDRNAMRIFNIAERFEEFQDMMTGIKIFIWFIASGTLLAGVIGVSNIMIIVVKERTKEIGIRKALGATPRSIISLIMQESIFITTLAGYLGMLAGIGLLAFFNSGLWLDFFHSIDMMKDVSLDNMDIFYNPDVDLKIALQATVFLIVSGAFAGLLPARKAASVNPIEALRDE